MTSDSETNASQLLQAAQAGDVGAAERIVELLATFLRKAIRSDRLGRRGQGFLSVSDLVQEAQLRLFQGGVIESAENSRYLFGAAVRAMRQVLVDHVRKVGSAKAGGHRRRTPLDTAVEAVEDHGYSFLELMDALDQLAERSHRQYLVVTHRFLLGMTLDEVAQALGISHSLAEKEFRFAKAWLRRELGEPTP